jgi:hypothetical protein
MRISASAPFSEERFTVGGEHGWLEVVYYPDNAMDEITNFFYHHLRLVSESNTYGNQESIAKPYLAHAGQLL